MVKKIETVIICGDYEEILELTEFGGPERCRRGRFFSPYNMLEEIYTSSAGYVGKFYNYSKGQHYYWLMSEWEII